MFTLFKKKEEVSPNVDPIDKAKAYDAYRVLVDVMAKKKVTKAELTAAIEEAIGYLGEITA